MKVGRRIAFVLLLNLALLAGVGSAAYRGCMRQEHANRGLVEAHVLLDHFNDVREVLQDIETGQRGFLLTGQAAFLQPYEVGRKALAGHLEDLRERAPRGSMLRNDVEGLAKTAQERARYADRLIAERRRQTQAAMIDPHTLERGKELMDDARQRIGALVKAQHRRIERLGAEARTTRQQVLRLLLLGTAVSVLLVLIGGGLLTTSITRPLRALVSGAEQLGGGDLAVRVAVTSRDETGALAVAFNTMAERLAQSEAGREAQRREHKAVLDSMNEGLHVIDRDGMITFENPASLILLGYELHELHGQPAHATIHHTRADGSAFPVEECGIYATLRDGQTRSAEDEVFWRKDGSSFPVRYTVSPVRGDDAAIIGAVVSFADLTARRAAQAELRRTQEERDRFFTMSLEMLCTLNRDGYFVMLNPSWERVLGYTPDEFRSKPFVEYLHPDDVEASLAVAERLQTTDPVLDTFENRYRCKDGSYKWLLWTCVVTPADGTYYAVARDITERKTMEAELERRVAERTEELTNTTQQLMQSAKLATMGELAASIAHELNNPLATVSLRTEMLLDPLAPDNPKRKSLEVIAQETERMADLVSNLLQFSRSAQQRSSTIDVREEVDATLALIKYRFPQHQIEFVKDYAADVPLLHADRQKLRQVFINLIGNAIDAMKEQEAERKLTVRVQSVVDGPAEGVAVEIADTGPGIPAALRANVLEPFFTTKIAGEGTGLGLAICKRIIDEHHGRLEIDSAEGQGTTMRIVLPVRGDAINGETLREGEEQP